MGETRRSIPVDTTELYRAVIVYRTPTGLERVKVYGPYATAAPAKWAVTTGVFKRPTTWELVRAVVEKTTVEWNEATA